MNNTRRVKRAFFRVFDELKKIDKTEKVWYNTMVSA